MLNCVICDDDAAVVQSVKNIVSTVFSENNCGGNIFEYTDSRSLLADIVEYKPVDIAILDIEMPYYDGMSIAAEIKKRFPESCVIFLTSHIKYALDAIELQVFRYAQKMDLETKLPKYINDAILMLSLQSDRVYTVIRNDNFERLPYKQMLCVKKDGKYSVILCTDKREIRVRKPLREVIDELDENEFLLIDRGCVVNIAMINRICEREVICQNGMHLSISRAKLRETKSRVALYWGNKI